MSSEPRLITCIVLASEAEPMRQLRAAAIAQAVTEDLILVDQENPTVEWKMHAGKRYMAATWKTVARSSLTPPREFDRDGKGRGRNR